MDGTGRVMVRGMPALGGARDATFAGQDIPGGRQESEAAGAHPGHCGLGERRQPAGGPRDLRDTVGNVPSG